MTIDPRTYRYRSRRPGQAALETRIKEICATRVRYGYRRVHVLLRREGWTINAKRVRRLHRLPFGDNTSAQDGRTALDGAAAFGLSRTRSIRSQPSRATRAPFSRGVYDGRIIDTAGDGILAEFASVYNAVK